MANDDDPSAPYKLYDGDKRIGIYRTRAEARRAQQKLESESGSGRRLFTIKDNLEHFPSALNRRDSQPLSPRRIWGN